MENLKPKGCIFFIVFSYLLADFHYFCPLLHALIYVNTVKNLESILEAIIQALEEEVNKTISMMTIETENMKESSQEDNLIRINSNEFLLMSLKF